MALRALAILGLALAPAALSASSCGCNGKLLVTGGYGGASGTIYAADPSNGTLTQFLTLPVGTGSSLGVIGAHGNWLYAMSSTSTGPYPSEVVRVNLTSGLVQGSVTISGYTCSEFAFDDALLGPDTILCVSYGPGYQSGVMQISFGAGVAKLVGTYPLTVISNQQRAYDPATHIFYMQLAEQSGTSHMLGMDVRTGSIVVSWYINSAEMFGGPLTIDPLSSVAYTTLGSSGNQAQLATVDMKTGAVTPAGPRFTGQFTQGGTQATVSSYDRCNLFFSSMYYTTTNPLQSNPVFIAVDMSSGGLAWLIQGQTGMTLAYYAGPALAQ